MNVHLISKQLGEAVSGSGAHENTLTFFACLMGSITESIIIELIQNHRKELKADTGIFDFGVQMKTNVNRERS